MAYVIKNLSPLHGLLAYKQAVDMDALFKPCAIQSFLDGKPCPYALTVLQYRLAATTTWSELSLSLVDGINICFGSGAPCHRRLRCSRWLQ